MNYEDTIIIPILKACITSGTFVVGYIGNKDNEHVMKITSISSDGTLDADVYPSCAEEILKSIHQQRINVKDANEIYQSEQHVSIKVKDITDIAHVMKYNVESDVTMNTNGINNFFFIRF